MSRASSFLEKDRYFKSDDHIAVALLPGLVKFLLKYNILNLKNRIAPKGIYPYVIARTKYIDHVFVHAKNNGFEQVLIMGAGFDSRAIRLLGKDDHIKVYEIDACHTLEAKLNQYKKRNIIKPDNDILIPIDLEQAKLKTGLREHGFEIHRKTLFILEGLIMYLSQDAVRETFNLISEYSSSGSLVVFDYVYASVLRLENKFYGEKAIYKRVKKANEKWMFGIEEGQIECFLGNFHLHLVEHLDSIALEHEYFKDESGKIICRINGTHCIVLAERDD